MTKIFRNIGIVIGSAFICWGFTCTLKPFIIENIILIMIWLSLLITLMNSKQQYFRWSFIGIIVSVLFFFAGLWDIIAIVSMPKYLEFKISILILYDLPNTYIFLGVILITLSFLFKYRTNRKS